MKTKLIGMLICVMLMTTLLAVAKPPQKIESKSSTETMSTAYDADVPVWEIGDQWTYKIDNINIVFNQTGTLFDLYLTIDELPLRVSALNETSYTLAFETTISGNSKIDLDRGEGPINISITFSNLELSGNIIFEKSTLGIKAFSGSFNGRFWVKIIQQPYFPIPWLPKFPVKIKSDLASDFSIPITPVMFPLNDSMMWNLSATNLTLNGEVRSPWLYLMLLVNSIYPFLPSEVAALLPVVDIKDALTTLGPGNVIPMPMIAGAFFCNNTEPISVPAGIYDAYNITIVGGMAQCFYAPAAGNIVKLTGNIQDLIPYITNINMELLSTTYS